MKLTKLKANIWPVKHKSQNQIKNQNIQLGLLDDVGDAEENVGLCEILSYAESVLESWRTGEKFRVLKNHPGNLITGARY